MGIIDAQTRTYMSHKEHFADAFNYLIYAGKPVIQPTELFEADTAHVAILPDGKRPSDSSKQTSRDVLRLWKTMRDNHAQYVMLGLENQTAVHYAMPVRNMLYDAMHYTSQVDNRRRERRETARKLNQSPAEFLSGFGKTDTLLPVVTLVMHFSVDGWDGPMSLHQMLKCGDEQLLGFVPNYRINLISPAQIRDCDFAKFNTNLGKVLKYIKHSQSAEELGRTLYNDVGYRALDVENAKLINAITDSKLPIRETKGEVDMCKATEEMRRKSRERGIMQGDEQRLVADVRNVMSKLAFSAEQALDLLSVPAEDRPRYLALLQDA